jgi:class 3 adenylate cyclase
VGGPLLKSLRSPDDIFRAELIEERSVQLGEQTIGRAIVQPGWRWSTHVQPLVGTSSCMVRHIGLAMSGRFHVLMDDGSEVEIGPDEVFDIPPGHDGWVVGDEPWETVEIAGIYGFGRPKPGGGAYVTTVLISDIVESTRALSASGAGEWNRVLARHFEQSRRVVDRFHGVFIKTTGDGVICSFDGAARAAHAAAEMHESAAELGLQLRVGVHTGEVESVPGDVRGFAVHLAARIAAAAAPGETLVSTTTREVASASDLVFVDRGDHELKGVEGRRQLFAVGAPDRG